MDTCPVKTCQSENLTGKVVKRNDHFVKKLTCINCGYTWEREFTQKERDEFNG